MIRIGPVLKHCHVDEELLPGEDGVFGWVDFHSVRGPRLIAAVTGV
jgi:hypothetical protein